MRQLQPRESLQASPRRLLPRGTDVLLQPGERLVQKGHEARVFLTRAEGFPPRAYGQLHAIALLCGRVTKKEQGTPDPGGPLA